MNRELPETHRQVLAALARRPLPELDEIDADVLEELRRWGMVMPKSFELTGMALDGLPIGERMCLGLGGVSVYPLRLA